MKKKLLIPSLILLSSLSSGLYAQEVNYAVEANIIYHFTKYIEWPEEVKSNFEIGVYGDDEAFNEIQKTMAGKLAGTRPIMVRKINLVGDVAGCMILFVTTGERWFINKVNAKYPDNHILLLAEKEGMATQGAAINFAVIEDKLKLEINKRSITEHHLKIATELLSLGIRVD